MFSLNIIAIPSIYQKGHVQFEFIDSIDKDDIDETDDISVIIELDYDPLNCELKMTDDINSNREAKDKLIENNKNYYYHNNLHVIDSLDLDTAGNFIISQYSPFIFIDYDCYTDYANDVSYLKTSLNHDSVSKVYVEKKPKIQAENANINVDKSLKLLPIEDAKKMISVSNTEYSGNGIKIGIMDEGIPNDLTNFSHGEIVETNCTNTSTHTTKVASIAGGTYGIAPASDLYITSYNGFVTSLEWLLSKGVDVINMSFGIGVDGKYRGYSAYLDYIIWQNYVSVVKSAGNRGEFDKYITHPGMGLNVFAVGSVDAEENISYYSSYRVDDSVSGMIMKPTLVAPGENIIIPNTYNSKLNADGTDLEVYYSGTSFAAPMVTGTIALLMEQFPRLMKYPEVIMSALITSTSFLPDQTALWDSAAGSGLLNYEHARQLLSDENYIDTIVTSSTNNISTILSQTITIPANTYADYSLVNIFNHGITTYSSSVIIPNFTKYQISIYDSLNSVVDSVQVGTNSNTIKGRIVNSSNRLQEYTIRVTMNGDKVGSFSEYLGLTVYVVPHIHDYHDPYIWVDFSKHDATCGCGATTQQGHAVSSSGGSLLGIGTRYKTCLLCGGSAEIGFVQLNATSTEIKYVTEKGSYILPNGVIVLVDEDIEAYMNHTLVFQKKNNSLTTE